MIRKALFLIGALALSLSNVASGQDHSVRIRNLDAALTVNSDGTLYVTERLTIKFTGRVFKIWRDLSVRNKTAEGRSTELDIRGLSVTNESGQWHRIEARARRGAIEVSIWVTPWPVNEDRVVVISYRVTNAIRFFQAGSEKGLLDELYWSVNDRDFPIDNAHVVVALPAGVAPTSAAVYTVYSPLNPFFPDLNAESPPVPADAKIETNGNTVGMSLPGGVPPREVMMVAVDWPAGHVTRPVKAPPGPGISRIQWWPLLIPLLIFLVAFITWHRRGRDPEEGSYAVRYEPVEGMSPAEVGTLVDDSVDAADLTATMVDLAARGFLRIEEIAESRVVGLFKSTDHIIHIIRERPEWAGLKLHESEFLALLSRVARYPDEWLASHAAPGPSSMVRMSSLKYNLNASMTERIYDAIYGSLISSGYYIARPDKIKQLLTGAGLFSVIIGLSLPQLAFRFQSAMVSPVPVIIAAVLTPLILFVFAPIMPARTAAGARAREAALGFKEFLNRVQDQGNGVIPSPEMFERYLPYAIALGGAGHWAKAFEELCREPPKWYVGGTGQFSASSFSSSISTMSSGGASSRIPRPHGR
jgi:hypothetical protein